jgi:hypothetical protein
MTGKGFDVSLTVLLSITLDSDQLVDPNKCIKKFVHHWSLSKAKGKGLDG